MRREGACRPPPSRFVRARAVRASSRSSPSTTTASGSRRTRRATRRDVLEPALAFIEDFGPRLHAISPHLRPTPRRHRRLAVPHLPRHALLQGQDAVQDDGRDPLPARARQGRPRARLLPAPGAGRGVRRRRHLAPRHADADRDPRGDRRRPGALARGDRGDRGGRQRAQARADRLRPRPSARRGSQAQGLRGLREAQRGGGHGARGSSTAYARAARGSRR